MSVIQIFEGRVQKHLEEKLSVIRILEDRVHKHLEQKLSVIESLRERNVISMMDLEASGIFIWTLRSFENKLREAKKNWNRYIESIPFYAYGYKLMVRLFPNGQDDGKKTHLSIYIVVTKGEYDNILPWGFLKQVTFTLIDQQENYNPRKNVVLTFTADPDNKVFKKPVEGETSPGWGFPKFISHRHLRTRRFIVDDTIFIKVQVDLPKAESCNEDEAY